MFQVMNLSNGEFLKNLDGSIRVFESGAVANACATQESISTGEKWQVRKLVEPQAAAVDWRERERERFRSGFYVTPQWMIDAGVDCPPDDFVHVSHKNPAMLAYTKSDIAGIEDRQSIIKPETYVETRCGKGSSFALICGDWHRARYAPNPVKFAVTADEIEIVYLACRNKERLGSCMTYPAEHYESSDHPVRVYGDSDLQLAYILDDENEVKARALVWPEKKLYGRLYGHFDLLASMLQRLGYSSGDFHGAKIRRIVCDNTGRLVLPYLDGVQTVSVASDELLTIDRRGDIMATNTDGLESGAWCEWCEDSTNGETTTVYTSRHGSSSWCEHCRDNNAFYCDGIHEYVHNEHAVAVDGESRASWWAEANAYYCERSGDWTESSVETVFVKNWHGELVTQDWCAEMIENHAFICRVDGQLYCESLGVLDDWVESGELRCVHVAPDDVPDGFDGAVKYHGTNNLEFNFQAVA